MKRVTLGLAVCLAQVLAVAGAPPSVASEPEPTVCAEARAAHPDLEALAAIRTEEGRLWREARRAGREGRSAVRGSLGAGQAGGGGAAGRLSRADGRHRQLMQRAAVLCGCRRELGDRDDANCERLYPGMPTRPPEPETQPPPPENESRKSSPRDAAPMESGS
ncbi:MAG: hypothetical protein QNK05_15110 [Myxococcota bacterium]|nr:hypothetical protein [Myxococcota bacterium]